MANSSYNLRQQAVRDYRQITSLKLPREGKRKAAHKLYPIEVVARRGSQVRIHYIGYGTEYDEWRESNDLVCTQTSNNTINTNYHTTGTIIQPYNLHAELRVKIKQALVCGKKQSPSVSIDMGFDFLIFKGGLQAAGVPTEMARGIQQFKLQRYDDLDHLLGDNWHYRGINDRGDYGFVILDSVEYYLSKRRTITEYSPSAQSSGEITAHKIDTGYSLKFSFIRGYGNRSTFGRDRSIFK